MAINKSKNQIKAFSLGEIKNEIIDMFQNDADIVALITRQENSNTILKYKNVFDSLIIDLTQAEAGVFVTMDTLYVSEGATIKCIELTMDIFMNTQINVQKLSSSEQRKYYNDGFTGNRLDVLVDKILRLLDGNKLGIGEMTLRPRNPMGYIHPNEKYYGKRLYFHVYDFA